MHKRQGVFVLLAVGVVASVCTAADWPQFRGPHRDGKSTETGLLKKWPQAGPKLIWSVDGLGTGYSSAAIAKGLVYTTGKHGPDGYIFCFDLNGKPQWKVIYGPEWTKSYPATRTTPTVNDGKLYVVSSFKITAGKGKHWAHPSISNGRLYIRHGDVMMAYDISANDR